MQLLQAQTATVVVREAPQETSHWCAMREAVPVSPSCGFCFLQFSCPRKTPWYLQLPQSRTVSTYITAFILRQITQIIVDWPVLVPRVWSPACRQQLSIEGPVVRYLSVLSLLQAEIYRDKVYPIIDHCTPNLLVHYLVKCNSTAKNYVYCGHHNGFKPPSPVHMHPLLAKLLLPHMCECHKWMVPKH